MVFFTYRLPNDKEGEIAASGSDTLDEILNKMGVCDELDKLCFFAACAYYSFSLSLSLSLSHSLTHSLSQLLFI